MIKAERFQQLTCSGGVRENLRRSSVRATAFTGVASIGDFVLRIASTAVLARLILPEHFGLVMMVMAVTAIADQLKELGLSAATVQQKEITHEQVSNLFWLNISSGFLIFLVVCGTSPLVARYYHEPRLTTITCLLASNFLFGGLMVQHQALLTRQLKLGHTSIVRLLTSLISALLAVFLAWRGYGFWALVWREISRSVLLAIGMWLCFPWVPGLPSWKTDVRSMVGFGTHLTLSNILSSLSAGADRFLIGRLWGASPVAVYRQAYQLIVAPTDQLLSPIYQVAMPGLSMLQNEPLRFQKFFKKMLTVVCAVTMPLSVFVAVYATEIVSVFLGPKWSDCVPIFQILSIGTFIKQAVGSTAFVLVSRGQSKTFLGLTVLSNVVLIAAMGIGVHWGIQGVAAADVITTWLLLVPRLHYSLQNSPFSIAQFFSTISRPAIASCVMALALAAVKSVSGALPSLAALPLGVLVAALVFILVWFSLPGGRLEILGLISDLRAIVEKRKANVTVELVVAG